MIPTGWIKLWTELLDDPKMAGLSDHLWRRTIELFLVAGENGHTGNLPDIPFMAWRLRIPMAEIETDLTEIGKTGIAKM